MLEQPAMIPFPAGQTVLQRIFITVDGVVPLLTHNPESMGVQVAPGKKSRIPEPEVEAEAGTYRMADGTCALKGEAFRAATVAASSSWKGKGRKSLLGVVSHIIVVEELVQLRRLDGSPISDYVIDRRRAIVMGKGIMRSRPRYDEWSCSFHIEFDAELIENPLILVQILHDAGQRMGVGDYRPSRKGFFGRFKIREYAIL